MALPDFDQIRSSFPDFVAVTTAIENAAKAKEDSLEDGEEVNLTQIVVKIIMENSDLFTAMFWHEYGVTARGTDSISQYFYSSYGMASDKKGEFGDRDSGLTLRESLASKQFLQVVIHRYRS